MATSTVISNYRAQVRAAQAGPDALPGEACGLALDWANGQAIAPLTASSQQSSGFDTTYDRIVLVSVGGDSSVLGAWISVGPNPTAAAGAGSMWIAVGAHPVPILVPAGNLIAGLQGATAGTLSMIPALFGSLS